MPIQKNAINDKLVRSDGSSINIDGIGVEGDGLSENLGNVNLKPFSVTSIKTSNETSTQNLGTDNEEYIVLVGQDIITENGLYKRFNNSSIKQTLNKNHYFFDTDGIRAIFIEEINRVKRVYIDNIHIGENFISNETTVKQDGSPSEFDVFDVFVKPGNITIIDLEVIGIKNNGQFIFHGTYKRTIYNNGGTYVDGGDHLDISKTKGTFVSPTVTFDLDNKKVKLTPGDDTQTTWFIKGKKSM